MHGSMNLKLFSCITFDLMHMSSPDLSNVRMHSKRERWNPRKNLSTKSGNPRKNLFLVPLKEKKYSISCQKILITLLIITNCFFNISLSFFKFFQYVNFSFTNYIFIQVWDKSPFLHHIDSIFQFNDSTLYSFISNFIYLFIYLLTTYAPLSGSMKIINSKCGLVTGKILIEI